MKRVFAAAMAIGLWASCGLNASAADVGDGFVSLFNGRDLAGWVKRGGSAEYQVEDGSIVGKCVPDTPGNTFLCTEKEFGNFILRLQYRFLGVCPRIRPSSCLFRLLKCSPRSVGDLGAHGERGRSRNACGMSPNL